MSGAVEDFRRKRKKGWHTRGPTIKRDICYVYFIGAQVGDDILIKIGFTTNEPIKRLHALQLGSPVELKLVGYFEGIQQDETRLHKRYSHLRAHREWFLLDEELAYEMECVCAVGGML